MPDSGDRFVWVDLETTGLEPEDSGAKILEFAVVVTSDDDLRELITRRYIIQHDYLDIHAMSPEALEMHSDSGLLLDLLRTDTTPWHKVAEEFTQIVQAALAPSKKPLLAGNSVQFDRKWLAKFAPAAMGFLHYRNLDVSTIYEMLLRSRHRDEAIWLKEQTPAAHRAEEDIQKSIYMYRKFRDLLGLEG